MNGSPLDRLIVQSKFGIWHRELSSLRLRVTSTALEAWLYPQDIRIFSRAQKIRWSDVGIWSTIRRFETIMAICRPCTAWRYILPLIYSSLEAEIQSPGCGISVQRLVFFLFLDNSFLFLSHFCILFYIFLTYIF